MPCQRLCSCRAGVHRPRLTSLSQTHPPYPSARHVIGDHDRGSPRFSRLSERRRVRGRGGAASGSSGSGSSGGCPRGCPSAAGCFGWRCAAGCCGWRLARRGGHRLSGSKTLPLLSASAAAEGAVALAAAALAAVAAALAAALAPLTLALAAGFLYHCAWLRFSPWLRLHLCLCCRLRRVWRRRR